LIGPLSSIRIKTEKAVPNNPENNANIKYNVPIFVDKNHLSIQIEIDEKNFIVFNLLYFVYLYSISIFYLYKLEFILR
jgi:hypothetical protein